MRSRRTEDRVASARRARERTIWWFRLGAAVFLVLQTAVETGDNATVSWLLAAGFAASVAVTWRPVHGDHDDRTVRLAGAFSMAADVVTVGVLLANNLTDPAEPIYLVGILAQIEATVRWPRRGGLVAGVVTGLAAGAWTLAVPWNLDQPADLSFATMRAGTIIALGVFLWSVVRQLSEQHDLLQNVFDTSLDVIVVLDRDGRVVSANAATVDMLGIPPEDLVGHDYRRFLHPDALPPGELATDGLPFGKVTDEPVLLQRRFVRPDGAERWLELNVASGAGDGLVHVSARDITERREAERRIAASEQRFRSLFEHNSDAVFSLDLEGRFTSVNPAAERIAGYSSDELQGTNFADLIAPEHLDRSVEYFQVALEGGSQDFELTVLARDGRRVDLDVTNMPIVVDDEVVGVFGVATDVTDRRQLERRLGHQATHDALTGLPNRAHLERVLAETLNRADRARTLLFIDLDRFKLVNDSLGHRSGDEVLLQVVDRLSQKLRGDDLLARWAGDEFCLLLGERTSESTAVAIAERLLEVIAEPFTLDGRKVHLSASIGVARSDAVDDPGRFVQIADLAMYEAKRAGRNRVAVYDASSVDNGPSQLDLEAELHDAVDRGLLRLHYQPIVELDTGRIVAVESLVRWPQMDGTLRPPASFIPLAEESGLIRALTRFVLDRACAQLLAWERDLGLESLQVWVNISAADLQDRAFVGEVRAALDGSGVEPERLVLEVTESMLLRDVARVDQVVDELRRTGVSFAIDDFGTGYSSMGQLHRLQVAACKIDRAFVEAAPLSERGEAVVRSMVELGSAFGFVVVGEGVERADELATLVGAGCRLAQGHLLATPMDPAELVDVLRAGSIELPTAGSPESR